MKTMIAVLTLALVPVSATATPQEQGKAIADEVDRRDLGFKDSRAKMVMTLKNRHGQTSVRTIDVKTLEVEGDGDKSLVVFNSPRDVRGTAFLTFSHAVDPDDQWLYLPALKRVKRIASNNKSGPFMGSEFAYEDLSSQEVDKYRYKFLRDEKVGSDDCFVIERYPVDKSSGYTRQVVWIDKSEYRFRKVDFFDRKDSLLKTLHYKGYRKYLGKYWRPDEMFMQNHITGKSTHLAWNEYEFQTGLGPNDLNKNRLKRSR